MDQSIRRRLCLLLALLAVAYASLACLHTVGDPDSGWHLATGRYHLQHHAVPSTDVLSYTSPGAPFLYPPFAGAILYSIFHSSGYAGLSCFCALAAAFLACYLLWRAVPVANLSAVAFLALAVPSLAYRLTPRADLFTTLFFAIFLAELWRFHRGHSARLWLLPIVMLLWVNLHPGFIAGLGLLTAYILIEVLLLPFGDLRAAARARLAKSWPWLAATALVWLLNSWGVGAIRSALQLAGVAASTQSAPRFVGELSAAPLSWHIVLQAIDLRDPDSSFWWLLAASTAALLLALRRRELGAAFVLGVSMAAALQRLRYQGLFSIVVIVIGGTLFAEAFAGLAARVPAADSHIAASRPPGRWAAVLPWAAVALIAILGVLTALRIADLASNRYYVVSASTSSFGPGESWSFPERAAAFIEREQLPGNIFQPYNLGGFTALRLGPRYLDYIDGRGVSDAVAAEEQALLAQSPDSALWRQVADRRNINVILLSLARYGGLGGFDLGAYCGATNWRPVYLDEVSLVLVRNTAQNKPWLDRLNLNCQTASFTQLPQATTIESYNFYANSGAVFFALSRDAEAEAAWRNALQLEPGDPNVHLFLAQLYQQQQRPADAEREYRAALSRRESSAAWYALGRLLATGHRYPEAERAIATSAVMTATPANQYKALGQVQLRLNKPEPALASLLKAERAGPRPSDPSPSACEFRAQIAEGRAEAARQAGSLSRAVELQQEAVRQTPQSPSRWKKLAELAAAANQTQLSSDAAQHALALETAPQH
jgi:Tfp pilus assembly protein PilF